MHSLAWVLCILLPPCIYSAVVAVRSLHRSWIPLARCPIRQTWLLGHSDRHLYCDIRDRTDRAQDLDQTPVEYIAHAVEQPPNRRAPG